jgi:hypothetical protein
MERTPELTELAKMIHEDMKGKIEKNFHPRCEYRLDTDNPELDDFDVKMCFGFYATNGNVFNHVQISSQKIRDDSEGDGMETYQIWAESRNSHDVKGKEESEVIKHIEDCICDIDAQLARLVADRHFGVFVDLTHEPSARKLKMWKLREQVFKHRIKDSSCCVCDAKTQHVTKCGHKLCFVCWNKLEKLTCPMCREEIDDQTYDVED